jgi:hypothetical protein
MDLSVRRSLKGTSAKFTLVESYSVRMCRTIATPSSGIENSAIPVLAVFCSISTTRPRVEEMKPGVGDTR